VSAQVALLLYGKRDVPHNDCNSSREDRRRRAPWIVTANIVSLSGGTQSDSR